MSPTMKRELAVTGAIVFGILSLSSSDEWTRRMAQVIAVNAVLCHAVSCERFLGIDLFFNTAFLVIVNSTSRKQPTTLLCTLLSLFTWLINHSCTDSVLVHTFGVQIFGALILNMWERR